MTPEEKRFLRAQAVYWTGPSLGSGKDVDLAWANIHATEDAARALLAAPPAEEPRVLCRKCGTSRPFGVDTCDCGERSWRAAPNRKVTVTPEGSRIVDPHEIMSSPGIRKHLDDVSQGAWPGPRVESRSVEDALNEVSSVAIGLWGTGKKWIDIGGVINAAGRAQEAYREERTASADALERARAGVAQLQGEAKVAERDLVWARKQRDGAWHQLDGASRERDELRARIERGLAVLKDYTRGAVTTSNEAVRILSGEKS